MIIIIAIAIIRNRFWLNYNFELVLFGLLLLVVVLLMMCCWSGGVISSSLFLFSSCLQVIGCMQLICMEKRYA